MTTAFDTRRYDALTLPEDRLSLSDPYREAIASTTRAEERNDIEEMLSNNREAYRAIVGEKTNRIIPYLEAIVDRLMLSGAPAFSGSYDCEGLSAKKTYAQIQYANGMLVAEFCRRVAGEETLDADVIAKIVIGGPRGESTITYHPPLSLKGKKYYSYGTVIGVGTALIGLLSSEPHLAAAMLSFGGLIGVPSFANLAYHECVSHFMRRPTPLARTASAVNKPKDQFLILDFLYLLPRAVVEVCERMKDMPIQEHVAHVKTLNDENDQLREYLNTAKTLNMDVGGRSS